MATGSTRNWCRSAGVARKPVRVEGTSLDLAYLPDRRLFRVAFTSPFPHHQLALLELVERTQRDVPGVVDSWKDDAGLVVLVHGARLAYFLAAACRTVAEVDTDEDLSFEELARLWPVE